MAKSRSRSPRWKHRPPPYRSPDPHRRGRFSDPFNDDEGFDRDTRRPMHLEEGRHGHNNSRLPPYNRFNEDSFSANIRKSPLESPNHIKRLYSPERHGENNRRFPPKYQDVPYKQHDKHFLNHKSHGRDAHDDLNGFRNHGRNAPDNPDGFRNHGRNAHDDTDGFRNHGRNAHDDTDGFRNHGRNAHDDPDGFRHHGRNTHDAPDGFRNRDRNTHEDPDGFRNRGRNTHDDPDGFRNRGRNTHDNTDGFRNRGRNAHDDPDGFRNHGRNAHDDPGGCRNHGRNALDDQNEFKMDRREGDFHEPQQREHSWDLSEKQDSRNKPIHSDHFIPPRRRNPGDFAEQKRYPEGRDFREHGPPPKRIRDTERLDFKQPPRHSHWRDEHTFRSHHGKEWPKDMDQREPSTIVHRTDSGEFTKIEYDYSHKSPAFVEADKAFSGEDALKHSRQEYQKHNHTKRSPHSKKTDSHSRGQEKCSSDRLLEPLCSSKESHGAQRDSCKNESDTRRRDKPKETERKENKPGKETAALDDNLREKSSDSKSTSQSNTENETIMVTLDMKKSMDKYRCLDNPSDRQMSQDLVAIGRKENFHPVFEHLESSTLDAAAPPKKEFTQEIITIIHEVKANYFTSTDVTLHERFSKMQTESKNLDPDVQTVTTQTNPEIHRRIDISLADLQSKSQKRTDVPPVNHRVIDDPNDLRHDIERRRKARMQNVENGPTGASVHDGDASSSYSGSQNQDTGEFQKSTRLNRPPFRKSTGRPPGSCYRGNANQYAQ
ncbi:BCLAF1 and THRAP3 family member 3 [Bombina bombina]|uniref:BCLAF1 and THRAP3 family member 3 n=1 Tax=Bombina bombina TaxID=8345 RepID=UPI00235AFF4D|nr:BCLAF1 and THRAP3 family member 3 [Bombina bombina]XP_053562375.1 BCLAF1 and THRAP3 family member 3 [Bombina bombina]